MPDIASLKLLGVVGVVSYAAARLATKAGIVGYHRCILVAVPLSKMPEMPTGFTVRALTFADLSRETIDVPPSVYGSRFEQGMTCLGAFNRRNELVGVTWIGTGPFEEDQIHVRFSVPSDAAWDTGLWIAPRYRLGRGFAALWAGTAEYLLANSRHYSMSWIADYNLPSLLSHKRMGAVKVGQVVVLRFFRWLYVSGGQPRLVRPDKCERADVDVLAPDVHIEFRNEMA